MNHLLLVEDDEALVSIIEKRFLKEGYTVVTTRSAEEAMTHLRNHSPDLALIDIGLPGQDGFQVAREINERKQCPFMFLTAMGSPEYRLEGYELGASDYVPKPFHFKELLLRVERILGQSPKKKPLRIETLCLTPESRTVEVQGSPPIALKDREFSLLYHLIENAPRIISREEVVDNVWRSAEKTPARAVDNTILKLRQSLGKVVSEHIKSIRGAGYQWLRD